MAPTNPYQTDSIYVSPKAIDERDALEHELQRLGREILLGAPGASESLYQQLADAGVSINHFTMGLIAWIIRPQATIDSAREFVNMAFVHPLLKHRLDTPKTAIRAPVAFQKVTSTCMSDEAIEVIKHAGWE